MTQHYETTTTLRHHDNNMTLQQHYDTTTTFHVQDDYLDKLTLSEFLQLWTCVQVFVQQAEHLVARRCTPLLKGHFQTQVTSLFFSLFLCLSLSFFVALYLCFCLSPCVFLFLSTFVSPSISVFVSLSFPFSSAYFSITLFYLHSSVFFTNTKSKDVSKLIFYHNFVIQMDVMFEFDFQPLPITLSQPFNPSPGWQVCEEVPRGEEEQVVVRDLNLVFYFFVFFAFCSNHQHNQQDISRNLQH